jgi:site-specific recombinase XerD
MAFNLSNYKFSCSNHKGKSVIFIDFPKNEILKQDLKATLKIYWSSSQKKWYCLDMPQYRRLLNIAIPTLDEIIPDDIADINMPKYEAMAKRLILKGYSPHTQRNYLQEFHQFLIHIKGHDADTFDRERLASYILYCIKTLRLKESTIFNRIHALRYYYEEVLDLTDYMLKFPKPKASHTLPKVLSKKDLAKMFEKTENIKHRLILLLVYGMGLRVSEIVGLKIEDIDSGRMMVHLRQAKGKKDRYVPLPQSVLELLREYYITYKPKEYLFEGMTGGQYTIRSAQSVFKQAMNRAGINKKVGIHGLRHSYATHLLEAGIDISFIQKLLGHKDIRTTLQYTKISDKSIGRIASPLDEIMNKK